MDTFQSYYKDGTSDTYDWRSLSGLYPLLMVATLPTLNQRFSGMHSNAKAAFFLLIMVFALVRPYKKLSHNLIEIVLLLVTSYIVSYLISSSKIQKANYFKDDVDHVTTIFFTFSGASFNSCFIDDIQSTSVIRRSVLPEQQV